MHLNPTRRNTNPEMEKLCFSFSCSTLFHSPRLDKRFTIKISTFSPSNLRFCSDVLEPLFFGLPVSPPICPITGNVLFAFWRINVSQHSSHSAASLQQEHGIFRSLPAAGQTGSTESRNIPHFRFRHFHSSIHGLHYLWVLLLLLRRHIEIPNELLSLPRLAKDYSRFIARQLLYRPKLCTWIEDNGDYKSGITI